MVVPLIATVGVNNKVTVLEKDGTSLENNSTGAYELDLTLVDRFDLAWREMHVKTDVFCEEAVSQNSFSSYYHRRRWTGPS